MKAFHGTAPLLKTSADVTTSNKLCVTASFQVVKTDIWPPVEGFLMTSLPSVGMFDAGEVCFDILCLT